MAHANPAVQLLAAADPSAQNSLRRHAVDPVDPAAHFDPAGHTLRLDGVAHQNPAAHRVSAVVPAAQNAPCEHGVWLAGVVHTDPSAQTTGADADAWQ